MDCQKRFIFVSLCVLGGLVAYSGCTFSSFPTLRGSGVAKSEDRDAADFTEIEVANAIELDVTVGPEASVVVTGDDNILPHIRTEVVAGQLKIHTDTPYSSDLGVKVTVTAPSLEALRGSGASQITINDVAGGHFHLELSGASHCRLTGNADVMDVNVSGASHGTLSGSAKQLNIECSGASHITSTELKAEKVTAEVSGASTAHVYSSQELAAEASGASTLRYAGQPTKVDKDISGASTVEAE